MTSTKALFLYMEHADLAGANALLVDVLKRNPRYQPALARLGDVHMLSGQLAKSIRYNERALALDPSLEMARRNLISSYIDVGDMVAARQLVEDRRVRSVSETAAGSHARGRLAGGR